MFCKVPNARTRWVLVSDWFWLTGTQHSKTLKFGTFKSLPIPPKLAKQSSSGQHRIVVESTVGATVAAVPVLPAATDTLEQDDIAMSLDLWPVAFTPGHAAPDVKADLL